MGLQGVKVQVEQMCKRGRTPLIHWYSVTSVAEFDNISLHSVSDIVLGCPVSVVSPHAELVGKTNRWWSQTAAQQQPTKVNSDIEVLWVENCHTF